MVSDVPVSTDSINGIQTTGAGNVVTIQITNHLSGTGSAVGAVTADLITEDLGAVPAVYRYTFDVAGRDSVTGDGVGYRIFATAKTDGVTATVVGFPYITNSEDASLIAANMTVVASGNNVILQATGVGGSTIVYSSTGDYVKV